MTCKILLLLNLLRMCGRYLAFQAAQKVTSHAPVTNHSSKLFPEHITVFIQGATLTEQKGMHR